MEPAKGSYLLVTPFKDESSMLEGLFESVISQKLRPMLWMVLDDGSKDDGLEKAKALAKGHGWISVVTRSEVENPHWLRYGSAVSYAVAEAVKSPTTVVLAPSYLAVLDADATVVPSYFEKLVEAVESDSKAAISSGMITTEGGGELEKKPSPRGCARLYRRDFLDGVGGFPATAAPDTVLEIKALNRGMKFVVVDEATGLHRRKSSQITGNAGLRSRGIIRYVLGMDFISAIMWAFVYARAVGCRASMGFIAGYLEGVRRRYPRIEDKEVRQFYSGSWRRFVVKSETRNAIQDLLR
jgi:glycosyltransferase involved in cell wall biosynthesis